MNSFWTANVTPFERVGRGYIGSLAVGIGVALLARASSLVVLVLGLLAVAAGIYLVGTGLLGRCPLYRWLGHVPSQLRD